MSKDFEERKNYDDLLSYRFERFDIELSDFLIIKTNRFFEYFIENYLGQDRNYGSEKKFNSKMVTDYKTTKKDLYEISTSKFGIFYFSVLDEVIVNRIIKIGKYEFVDIKKIVSEVINRIHLIISDFSFVSHELNLHDDISNRLDHLNKLSITRGRNISEIFKGSEINRNGPEISEIDTTVEVIQEGNIDSAILTHVILSWLWFAYSVKYSNSLKSLELLNFEGEDRDKIDNTPRYVKLFVIFSIVFVVLDNSLLFLNIYDEFHWLISILLLVILYGVLTIKSKKSDYSGGIEILSELEKKMLFHEMQTILNSQSYHPESIKNKLNYFENKGLSIPQSMYSMIQKPLENNTFIFKSEYIRYLYKADDPTEPESVKSRDYGSFKSRIYGMGEVILKRKDDEIELKYSDSNLTDKLQELHIDLNMTIKPMGNYWTVETDYEDEKNNPEVQGLNCQLENISIGHDGDEGWSSSFQKDSIFVIYKEKLILPKKYLLGIDKDSQFIINMKSFFGVDINELTKLEHSVKEPKPMGRIYFNYFTDDESIEDSDPFDSSIGEMHTFIGLRDDIYEKVLNHTYKGGVENIRFKADCWGYSSSFKYGSARDLILDQSVMSERRHGEKRNISKTVLKIRDLTINFSN